MRLVLPFPPSVNHYYRRVGSRTLISRKGREYRRTICGLLAPGSGMPQVPLEGRLAVALDAFPPDRRIRDLDNIHKPVIDALEHAGIYRNDSQIDLLITRRASVVPQGKLIVDLVELPLRHCPLCDNNWQSAGLKLRGGDRLVVPALQARAD